MGAAPPAPACRLDIEMAGERSWGEIHSATDPIMDAVAFLRDVKQTGETAKLISGNYGGLLVSLFEKCEELFHRRRQHLVLFIDDRSRTVKGTVLQRHGGKRQLGDLLRNRALRHNRNALVNLHRAFHGFDVVEFRNEFHADIVFVEDFVERLARRDFRLETDELLPREHLELGIFQLGERVMRMADEHECFLVVWDDVQQGVLGRIRDQPQVHHIAEHVLINLAGAAVFDLDVHSRVAPHEFLDVGRQVVQADAVNRRHADVAGDGVLHLLQMAVHCFVGLDDLFGVIEKQLPLVRKAEPFFAALNERRFKQPLHHGNLLADGRLGDSVDVGGLGEAFGFDEVAEYFQALDVHKL